MQVSGAMARGRAPAQALPLANGWGLRWAVVMTVRVVVRTLDGRWAGSFKVGL